MVSNQLFVTYNNILGVRVYEHDNLKSLRSLSRLFYYKKCDLLLDKVNSMYL